MKIEAAPTVRAGQRGLLMLTFEGRGGRTVLAERYSGAPFGAVRANYPDDSGMPEVQITNPSGGILGGDSLEIEVSLAPGSAATVLTQAANKAYRGPESSQRAVFRVGDGALLEYVPHHLIPYSGSNHRQAAEFRLAPDTALITWDAFAAGRVARGERFSFERLRGGTRVFRQDVPEVVDGFDLSGGTEHLGGYSYVAAAYVMAPRNLEPLANLLHESFSGTPGALASASAPTSNLSAVRAVSDNAHSLYALLNRFRAHAREFMNCPAPAKEMQ